MPAIATVHFGHPSHPAAVEIPALANNAANGQSGIELPPWMTATPPNTPGQTQPGRQNSSAISSIPPATKTRAKSITT